VLRRSKDSTTTEHHTTPSRAVVMSRRAVVCIHSVAYGSFYRQLYFTKHVVAENNQLSKINEHNTKEKTSQFKTHVSHCLPYITRHNRLSEAQNLLMNLS